MGDSYENPILFGNFPDPSILRDGEHYYLVNGGTAWRSMLMWHSRDLVHWTPLYYVLEGYCGNVWAPELVKHGDTYYIYNYGPGDYGPGTNWVVTTKDIHSGPWSEPIPIEGLKGIDPGHVVGEDGRRYVFMSKNMVYPLTDDGLAVAGEGRKVCDDWPIPEDWDIEGVCTESPKLFWRDGWCYLTVAQGGTFGPPTSHCVISYRSQSIFGPWEASPYNPISHTWSREEKWWSKGHATLVDTPAGDWYMIYHGILNGARHLGRMTLMEPLEWTMDGWFKVPDSVLTGEPIPLPVLPSHSTERLLLSDTFDTGRLGLQWNAPTPGINQRLSFEKVGLLLKAQGTSLHDSEPLLCLNQHDAQMVTTELTVEEGSGGGLTFYYSANYSCGIALHDGSLKVFNMGKGWLQNKVNLVPYEDRRIFLQLRNDHGIVSPWYSSDGREWRKINLCFDITGWHPNNINEGTGWVRPGIFAFGTGNVLFGQFRYEQFECIGD
ncbi:family 43 glycosylhydrolase [Paenibacillus sp. PL2-23]|uniref:family 43 glycosylhydrolase n=1 Tax=Paenibacillus sp. PL2-23 TaxID=2100729 RepID=UPI0030FB75D7